ASGEFDHTTFERREFCLRDEPAAFLPLAVRGLPVTLAKSPPAPLALLRELPGRPTDWKLKVGFPAEVREVLDLAAPAPPGVEPWLRVPVDRPERLIAALVLTPSDGVLGFSVRSDAW